MKKNGMVTIFIFLSFLFLNLYSIEIGKIIDEPSNNIDNLKAKDGILVSNDKIKKGFSFKKSNYDILDPVYSILSFEDKIIVGTGDNCYIINLTKNDTIMKLNQGQMIRNLIQVDKSSFLASVEPNGIILKVDLNRKVDTLFKKKNSVINGFEKIDDQIFILIDNEIYKFKNKNLEKMLQVDDRNIIKIKQLDKTIFFSTEGDGKFFRFKDGKMENIISFKNSGILDFYSNNGRYYIILNTNLNRTTNPADDNFNSYIIKIDKNLIDTLYTLDSFISKSVKFYDGIILFLSSPLKYYYFDFKDLYFGGTFEYDFITSVLTSFDNILFTTEKNQFFTLEKSKGKVEFFSTVLDLNSLCKITSIYPQFSGKEKFYFRFGNSSNVDETWTGFYPVISGYNSNLPASRFFQYKIAFDDENDVLKKVEIYYSGENRNPKINRIKIYPPMIMPENVNLQNVNVTSIKRKNLYPEFSNENIVRIDQKKIFVKWEAFDPDKDRLSYSLYLLDKDYFYPVNRFIEDSNYILNYDFLPTGKYRLKLVASDSLDNLYPYKTEFISEEFLIDNTPPVIKGDIFEKNVLKFYATDQHSFINKAEISLNGNEFYEILPMDQIYDNREESFNLKIKWDSDEPLNIIVKVYDLYGNVAYMQKLLK